MDKFQALYSFWNSFGLKAYEENSVPESARVPYITYEVQSDDFFGDDVSLTASLWYHSTSWAEITQKSEEIAKWIGIRGKFIKFDDGHLWVKRRKPFTTNMVDDSDDLMKRIILNIDVQFWTED